MVLRNTFLFLLSFMIAVPSGAFAGNLAVLDGGYSKATQSNVLFVSEGREAESKRFISGMGDEVIRFLSNDKLSVNQKAAAFGKLLNRNFDMDTISRFSLGRNWRTATPEQKKQYQRLFKQMIIEVYSRRLTEYQGESFTVQSSRPTGKRDYLVSSLIVPDNGQKIKVDWRVRDDKGRFQIIDVIIEGVSMTLTQRAEFASVIQRGGGNIDALITHLKR